MIFVVGVLCVKAVHLAKTFELNSADRGLRGRELGADNLSIKWDERGTSERAENEL